MLQCFFIIGLGDFTPEAVTALSDPCPLPNKESTHRRSLNEKDKLIYAPFSGVGGIVYDKDAVYIDLGGSHSHNRKRQDTSGNQIGKDENPILEELRSLTTTVDKKLEETGLRLFSKSAEIKDIDMEAEEELHLQAIEDEDDLEVEQKEEQMNDIVQKSYEVFEASDGRKRRRVIFDKDSSSNENADLADALKKEVESLKFKKNKSKFVPKGENLQSEDEMDDSNSSDSDTNEVGAGIHSTVVVKNPDVLDVEIKEESESENEVTKRDENVLQLAEKLKKRMQDKDKKSANTNTFQRPSLLTEEKTNALVFEDIEIKSDVSSDFEDENMGPDSFENTSDYNSGENTMIDEENAHDSNEESNSSSEDATEDNQEALNAHKKKRYAKFVEKTKDERYKEAEEGFYSRFHQRSLQKMIYDPNQDYLQVGSKADFDLANSAAREKVISADEDYLKDLFVGGDYAETAKNILDDDDEFADDEDPNDFEELDKPGDEPAEENAEPEKTKEEDTSKSKSKRAKLAAKREEMKKKLKEKFDMEYDGGGDKNFLSDWKSQVEEQTKVFIFLINLIQTIVFYT